MRILDEAGNEITNPDYVKGYTRPESILVKHHEATTAVEGKGHYETIHEYPNGGKDVKYVWDVEPVEAHEAWDEFEDIQRYIKYTDEELAAIQKRAQEEAEEAAAPPRRELNKSIQALEKQVAENEVAILETAELSDDVSDNTDAIVELGSLSDAIDANANTGSDNEDAAVDLAAAIAELEERIAVLEAAKEGA